ncbi:MAG: type III pantothenate kinase [Porcipelethomonas sp.]
MLLAIDIGNSTVVMGCMDNGKLIAHERSVTDSSEIEINYTDKINILIERSGISPECIDGVVISSVVPLMTDVLQKAVLNVTGKNPLIVKSGLKYNFKIGVKNLESLGSDRISCAAAAIEKYGAPLIIADMGTATTISVIDRKNVFIGGLILPGVKTAMNALINNTAQLPQIKLPKHTEKIIGHDTVSAIENGIVYGNAACLDGLLDRISEELGYSPKVIATGGNMPAIIPFCRHEMNMDRHLLLKGLDLIFNDNREAFENA